MKLTSRSLGIVSMLAFVAGLPCSAQPIGNMQPMGNMHEVRNSIQTSAQPGPQYPYTEAFGMAASAGGGPYYEEGSLWSEGSRLNDPFSIQPVTNFRLGDIIMVFVQENFESREEIRYENETESDVSFNFAGLWNQGVDENVFGTENGAIDFPRGGFQGTDEYDGQARGRRRSTLTVEIACTVNKILPDGRLMIEGRQSRIIGKDKKTRILSGLVRPEDINPVTRVVDSSRIADSQLRWEGKGPGENISNPGLVHRIFDFIPLF